MDIKKHIESMGFKHTYEWTDPPETTYPTHAHQDRVVIGIVSGDITFHFEDEDVTLDAGAIYEVAPGRTHTAVVGTNGCGFVVGEMVEGDS